MSTTATNPVVEKGPVLGKPGAHIRSKARALSRQIDSTYMELARLLYRVYAMPADEDPTQPLWALWGFTSFYDWAEEELEIGRQKARFLLSIWEVLEVRLEGLAPETRERIVKLGISKARLLTSPCVLTLENAEEWAATAEKSSCRSLEAYTRKYRAAQQEIADKLGVSPEEVKDVPMPEQESFTYKGFLLTVSQAESLESALDKAALVSGSRSREFNLSLIALDFLATHAIGKGDNSREAKLRYLTRFEDLLGVRLVVVDGETDDLIYGISTLERLAKGED